MTTIGNVCAFTNGKAHEQNVVEYGEYIIVNSKFISSDGVVKKYSNKQICPLFKNDIVMVMSDVPNGKAMSKCFCIDKDNKYTLNQRICALRTKQIPLYYMMQINRNDYFMKFDDGVKQTNLRKDDVLACPVYSTTIKEQTKIADFLSLIDQRIEKQRRLVESLKKYKRGLLSVIFDKIYSNSTLTLGEICNITTGKLDANAMVVGGKYRFYTCAREYFEIDTYAFDTDALLISGNGANVGYIHHYCGKFNAYQRTYVLDRFQENIMYIYYYLQANLHPRIEAEKKAGNTPYIVLSTLSDMLIKLPTKEMQDKIAKIFAILDKKITTENDVLERLNTQKQGLLQQMFI